MTTNSMFSLQKGALAAMAPFAGENSISREGSPWDMMRALHAQYVYIKAISDEGRLHVEATLNAADEWHRRVIREWFVLRPARANHHP
jgi:hypothetical protein